MGLGSLWKNNPRSLGQRCWRLEIDGSHAEKVRRSISDEFTVWASVSIHGSPNRAIQTATKFREIVLACKMSVDERSEGIDFKLHLGATKS